uniref:Uncharacterized protein n=1 Tax=mine drainage metagenome TaxID=410659 RepID=E6PYJ3_9ZZZZ
MPEARIRVAVLREMLRLAAPDFLAEPQSVTILRPGMSLKCLTLSVATGSRDGGQWPR